MLAERLTKFLKQKYSQFEDTPLDVVDVVLNVPRDELVNDVTVYVNKESGMSLEALSENQLVRLGHKILEDVFLQLAAPTACSLHLVYQFFDASVTQYENDPHYFVGDYWESEQGYWIARSYLDLFYDESADPVLQCRSWLNDWMYGYRPDVSQLLAFVDPADFEPFLYAILETPRFADMSIAAVTADELSHRFYRYVIEASWPMMLLKRNEENVIILGYQLFEYALRCHGDNSRKMWFKIVHGEGEVVSFEKRNSQYWYQTWQDEMPTRFKRAFPIVFNGRAKRELATFLRRQLNFRMLGVAVTNVEVLEKDDLETVVTVTGSLTAFFGQQTQDRLLSAAENLVWDVYDYYERPRRCYLQLQHDELAWHLTVRLDHLDDGYRMIRRSGLKRYEARFFFKDDFLRMLKQPFRKNWDRYRYVYRPRKEVEA